MPALLAVVLISVTSCSGSSSSPAATTAEERRGVDRLAIDGLRNYLGKDVEFPVLRTPAQSVEEDLELQRLILDISLQDVETTHSLVARLDEFTRATHQLQIDSLVTRMIDLQRCFADQLPSGGWSFVATQDACADEIRAVADEKAGLSAALAAAHEP
jgi:hypothetical protein